MKDDLEMAKNVYKSLLGSNCIVAQSGAAADCLRLNILVSESVKMLEEISQRNDIGIHSVSAKYALKTWRGEIPGKTL